MIAKQVKGSGFRGTLNYLMLKPEAELIGSVYSIWQHHLDQEKAVSHESKSFKRR